MSLILGCGGFFEEKGKIKKSQQFILNSEKHKLTSVYLEVKNILKAFGADLPYFSDLFLTENHPSQYSLIDVKKQKLRTTLSFSVDLPQSAGQIFRSSCFHHMISQRQIKKVQWS